jgi:hypothetical protein
MIKITTKSIQNEIIQELFLQVSHKSPLYIELESLPYFLSSIPSLKVFLYKIQNYPREIFWYSFDNSILEFLHQNSINIEFPYNPQNAIVNVVTSNLPTIIDLNKQKTQPKSQTTYVDYHEKLSQLKSRIKKNNINSTSYFSPVEQSSSTSYSKGSEKIDFKQDLDSWLKKIETTKDSLSRYKEEVINEKNIRGNNWFGFSLNRKWAFRGALSLGVMSLVAIFVLFFPTNTYKLDVAPSIKQNSYDLQFSDTAFTKNRFKIQTQDDIETTGQNEIVSNESRASGKVALINTSTTSISFKKDGVILISEDNGLEYRQKSSDADAAVFTVFPKNNQSNQPVEINIQSITTGNSFDLPINSSFRVYNIRGETFGGTVKAISTSKVEAVAVTKDKVISQEDLSLLRSKAEVSLNNLKLIKLEEIKSKGQLINNNWVKTLDTTYKYSGIPNDVAPKVSIQADSEIEIYSVSNDSFRNLVTLQLKVNNVSDIKIVETKIENDKVLAKLFMSSKENPEIIKKDIIGNLANTTNIDNTAQIQQKYPNIKRVSKDFSGIKLPLVTPRSKVEVNELNIN